MTTTISGKKKRLFDCDNMFFGGVTGSVRLGYNIGKHICDDIKNAQKCVKICTPYISKPQLKEIFREVLSSEDDQQEKRADAKVDYSFVITNGSFDGGAFDPQDYLKALEDHANFKIQVYKKRLHKEGSVDKSNDYSNFLMLHAKFYIIDDEVLYLSSSNFTKSGMEEGLEFYIRIKKNCGNESNDCLIDFASRLFNMLLKEHETLGVNCHNLETDEKAKSES